MFPKDHSLFSIKFASLCAFLVLPLMLTGCLSHLFLDSSSRLQVENATEKYSVVGVGVVADDGSVKEWISETILPGERSRVVEEDLVGDFTLYFKYTKSKDGSGEVLREKKSFDLDGGSLYLSIGLEGDSLTYNFK